MVTVGHLPASLLHGCLSWTWPQTRPRTWSQIGHGHGVSHGHGHGYSYGLGHSHGDPPASCQLLFFTADSHGHSHGVPPTTNFRSLRHSLTDWISGYGEAFPSLPHFSSCMIPAKVEILLEQLSPCSRRWVLEPVSSALDPGFPSVGISRVHLTCSSSSVDVQLQFEDTYFHIPGHPSPGHSSRCPLRGKFTSPEPILSASAWLPGSSSW